MKTSSIIPVDRPALSEACDTMERVLAMHVDAGRLDRFGASIAALEAFERQLRLLEAEASNLARDTNRSAVLRGVAMTRLREWVERERRRAEA